MSDPRSILRERGLSPKKSFGQNFLIDAHVTQKIAEACVPHADIARTFVVEIGAGTGELTAALHARAKRLIAIERDRDLIPVLTTRFDAAITAGTFTLEEADAKQVPLLEWFRESDAESKTLCGNLPYQLTGFLLERAITCAAHITRAVFLVQAEVAERLSAEPSTKEYGGLTVFANAAFTCRTVLRVPPQAFYPAPEVSSAVVCLTPRGADAIAETDQFRALVKGAFAMRRKTLRNAWRGIADERELQSALEQAGSSLDARGETLSFTQFGTVAKSLETLAAKAR